MHGISLPFGVKLPSGSPLGSKVQSPPVRKSKLGAAIDTYVAPVIEKITPAVAKPHLASANRYVKQNWADAKKEWAECKKIYGKARNNYEKVDKVITILQRNKYNIMKGGAVFFVFGTIEANILNWYENATHPQP